MGGGAGELLLWNQAYVQLVAFKQALPSVCEGSHTFLLVLQNLQAHHIIPHLTHCIHLGAICIALCFSVGYPALVVNFQVLCPFDFVCLMLHYVSCAPTWHREIKMGMS